MFQASGFFYATLLSMKINKSLQRMCTNKTVYHITLFNDISILKMHYCVCHSGRCAVHG